MKKHLLNSIGMKFALIPRGTFLMGSPADEKYRKNNEFQHQVTLTRDYYLGVHVVTQSQWKTVMGTEPWLESGGSKEFVKVGRNFPATYVSWYDAISFCEELSRRDGVIYRLPTEAEWERACRGGTQTQYSFGSRESELSEYAWTADNSVRVGEKYPHEVGKKLPNPYGLFDMHGNVLEWCADAFSIDYYLTSPPQDPKGPVFGSSRVKRGGACPVTPKYCRSSLRIKGDPWLRRSYTGLRVVQSPTSDQIASRRQDDSLSDSAAKKHTRNSIGMRFSLIPRGTFLMGAPYEKDFKGRPFKHRVTLTQDYHLGIHEVTQGQWKTVMGTEPWVDGGQPLKCVKIGENYPATCVTWHEAVSFCESLSLREGEKYRLPTEAEWERACRGDTETRYHFGNRESDLGSYAWYGFNAYRTGEEYAHEVGKKLANAYGLFDMHGNIWEWCSDFFSGDYYSKSTANDPKSSTSGSRRVGRGGTWRDPANRCESSERRSLETTWRCNNVGFRVARGPSSESLERPLNDC